MERDILAVGNYIVGELPPYNDKEVEWQVDFRTPHTPNIKMNLAKFYFTKGWWQHFFAEIDKYLLIEKVETNWLGEIYYKDSTPRRYILKLPPVIGTEVNLRNIKVENHFLFIIIDDKRVWISHFSLFPTHLKYAEYILDMLIEASCFYGERDDKVQVVFTRIQKR